MPLYARYGVRYAWLTDPVERTLEAYRLAASAWVEVGRFAGADQVCVPPFEAVSIDLKGLWLPQGLVMGFGARTTVPKTTPPARASTHPTR
ncbi:MAG: Uma2 family endonuclease [Candidatus Thiosymbion ectosymbiont of Robbea hypermnestra]|nr:Uma2 family endonuclease [Candidatus Thiosymbion ectosymbiont of Robbea hypermnestra]